MAGSKDSIKDKTNKKTYSCVGPPLTPKSFATSGRNPAMTYNALHRKTPGPTGERMCLFALKILVW